ncbi:MAG: hypothetical protein JWM25_1368 [Thermoleophilia bacterium]|nr:hypothetical protein [Thermoleophilia bacterium]MCZ4496785.1 hypothetical protein [Thermoleophilia bacterium]
MTEFVDVAPAGTPRPFRRAAWELLAVSLTITALAALVAVPIARALDERWALVFVYARWACIFTLLAAPALQQVANRRGTGWQLPWALRTPTTALLLICESVAFDIISATTD